MIGNLIYVLLSAVVVASSTADALFKFRITNRRSALCASLLTVTRAKSHLAGRDAVREELENFHRSVLSGIPTLETQNQPAIEAQEGLSPEKRRQLSARIYDIERTFQQNRDDRRIVGTALLSGGDEISRFFRQLEEKREFIHQAAETIYANPNSGFLFQRYIDLDSRLGTAIMPVLAALGTGGAPLLANWFYQTGLSDPSGFKFASLVALAGLTDVLYNHIRSYENGHQKLQAWAESFASSNAQWAYWSKDLVLAKTFMMQATEGTPIPVRSLLMQNVAETSMLNRFGFENAKPKENRGDEYFSIDALLQRDENGVPRMILVLRARPSRTPKEQKQTSAVQEGLGTQHQFVPVKSK